MEDVPAASRHQPHHTLLLRCAGDKCAEAGQLAGAIAHYRNSWNCSRATSTRDSAAPRCIAAANSRPWPWPITRRWSSWLPTPAARNNRGVLLEGLGAFDDALADLTVACRLLPLSSKACCNRGRVLCRLNRLHEAIDEFDDTLRMNPYNVDAYRLRAQARHWRASGMSEPAQEIQLAIVDLDRLVELDEGCAQDYSLRGQLHLMRNEFQQAAADGDAAVKLNPDLADGYAVRGAGRFHLEQYEPAIADCSVAIQLGLKWSRLHAVRGMARFRQKDPEEALEDLDLALQSKPDDSLVARWRAGLL